MWKRVTVRLLIALAATLCARTAGAQCEMSTWNDNVVQTNNCSGSNQYETRYTTRFIWLYSSVSCNQSGYFGGPTGSNFWPVDAISMCGTVPQNYQPHCMGYVDTVFPRGFDSGYDRHIYETYYEDASWDGVSNCSWSARTYVYPYVAGQGCQGYLCCSYEAQNTCTHSGGSFYGAECACEFTPIILSLDGPGLELTDALRGVEFDLFPDGVPERLGWTRSGGGDAFLALDRNGNGRIDDGKELFGSSTDQPPTSDRNGFNALAVFDVNRDGRVDQTDPVYGDLRLWIDRNHDGVSSPAELQSLRAAGVTEISVAYRESRRVDQNGNRFKYAAPVRLRIGSRTVLRQAWDVVLVGVRRDGRL